MSELAFGPQLRRWRQQRGLTQLALSLAAEVSTRHLSWLESGKAAPSRAMVLRLGERLALPLRERNALLAGAGYAPLYPQHGFDDPALAPARALLQRLLDAHQPWPALAVDRHWQLLAHNRMLAPLLDGVAPSLLAPPVNVLRLTLHPQGLAPRIEALAEWRAHVLARLQRQWQASGDAVLARLHDELRALPGPQGGAALLDAAVPLTLRGHHGGPTLRFLSALTVFGAPHEVTLAELAIETLLPADAATAEALRRLHAALPPAPDAP